MRKNRHLIPELFEIGNLNTELLLAHFILQLFVDSANWYLEKSTIKSITLIVSFLLIFFSFVPHILEISKLES